jgi:AcrR family transcriptional regulator
MTSAPRPIREQTRHVVRSLIAQTALGLFASAGYESTTMDEVAAAAGVSRRTIFNYFASKEDLALHSLTIQGEKIADRFSSRPLDEDLWDSLRASFEVLEEIDVTRERRVQFVTLITENEALRAGHAEKQFRWQALLAPLIEQRLPLSANRHLQARAIAATSVSCLQIASEEWARLDGTRPQLELYDEAMRGVRQ